jgi:hypothetical protein
MNKKDLRPQISANLLLDAIRQGNNRITVAMMNPADQDSSSEEFLGMLKMSLKVTGIIPSPKVERGWLYIETVQLR